MKRKLISVGLVALLSSGLAAQTPAVGDGPADVFVSPSRRAPGNHPLGLLEGAPSAPFVTVRELELTINEPLVDGERVVLSTVGVEREDEFFPLLAVLVDRTFPEDPDGRWLAVWNLGHKGPGVFSVLRSLVPGWTANKRPSQKTLDRLENRLDHFESYWKLGKIDVPNPSYKVSDGHRRSYWKLTLNGLKTAAGFITDRFWAQFLYRGYLLRRWDDERRDFQHTYVGLTWFADQLAGGLESAVSPKDLQELKFRMLSSRSSFGRWVLEEEEEKFVHAYEAQMRDHLWGTSNRLAAEAVEFHLGFEEFHRETATGVPLSLGGVLYYDPAIAPSPEQVRWSIANPFDLTYNPFTHPEVLEQAEDGEPVPLAVYTYQSNLALKPIITVDFFDLDNPRLRQSATYWRRVGNEAFASSGVLGFLYNTLRGGLTFMANRKGLTWLGDRKVALGIEELRLALISSLYFEPAAADALLDDVDRLMLNPLTQAGREQRLRARLQYLALTAGGGRSALDVARREREREIRQTVVDAADTLGEADYAAYRADLVSEGHLDRLERFAADAQASTQRPDKVRDSLLALSAALDPADEERIERLAHVRLQLLQRRGLRAGQDTDAEMAAATLQGLRQVYARADRSDRLEADLARFRAGYDRELAKEEQRRLKSAARFFEYMLERHLAILESLVDTGGDLYAVSPWYVARAGRFIEEIPVAAAANPMIAGQYEKKREQIDQLFEAARHQLALTATDSLSEWLERERRMAMLALERAQLALNADAERAAVAGGRR